MTNKKEIIEVTTIIVFVILLISGVAFATYSWVSPSSTGRIKGLSECFIVDYTKGTDIIDGTLPITDDYTKGLSVTVKASLSSDCKIEKGTGVLYLNTKEETSDLLLGLVGYKVFEGTKEVATGVVSSKSNIPIYSEFAITKDEKSYTVYFWLLHDEIYEKIDNNTINDIPTSKYSGEITMSAEGR